MVNRAKPSQKLFIFSIFSAHILLVYSSFNFEELYDVKYGFEISKEPVLLSEVSFFNFFVLTNAVTQRCHLFSCGSLAVLRGNKFNFLVKTEIPPKQ